ncbi:Ubiquitin conjugation factor E4 A [Temnothorax longispinosus]|uniref:Ubiquitin conjugation factor E4 A n=1 Tax=Temnothorax longispinosus TaxID=300112 RepID=A0A4S2JBH3_9HYME|nr:Ubiquitin conjugation factor E4 A [Temnothorax longispinosus]
MCNNIRGNPFAGLFSTDNDAVSFSSEHRAVGDGADDASCAERRSSGASKDEPGIPVENATETADLDDKVDRLMAHVFGLTLRRAQDSLVFVDADSIEHAVFERLMLPDPKPKARDVDSHVVQTQVITYLYECYCRLKRYRTNGVEDTVRNACQIVLRNANTALQEPDLFQYQESELSSFVSGIVEELIAVNRESDVEDVVTKSFSPVLDIIHKEAVQSNLFTFCKQWFALLNTFSTIDPLAKLIICHSTPKNNQGCGYSETLLGAFFSISCLPKTSKDPYDLFDKPLRQPNTIMEETIPVAMGSLSEALHKVFHSLLKCSTELRHLTLQWLGNCLHANANRGKLWNSHMEMGLLGVLCVSDGFMLNMGNVLLRLCQPFCAKLNDAKVPKIDPTYCSAEAKDEAESLQRGIHMKGLSSETCLIPTPEGESRPTADSFGFITECFFLTHRALDLGYRVILDKFLKTNQDLARIQRAYNDARTGGSSEVLELITQRMETEMTNLLVPKMLEHLAKFHAMTAFWLTQVNLHIVTEEDKQNFAPKEYIPVTFPLSETVPITLSTLAQEAESNMEAVQPPLFLRFINLLMNDAVFLLDEALSNMAQLRQMLQARESGEWNKLPPNEREQQAAYLQHIGMIARFDNILGRKTIQTIKMLTTEIKSIFCHPIMVDRIASMLNYLLLQLVGPNKKNLKVNDQKEYAFNPANLVLNICEIYINLSKSESFTLAVSQDGRSYSPELFKLADNVLVRIGGVGILGDLDQFAKSVEEAANQKREEDEILTDVPDEFLDPIMSTVMTDPVVLPSSQITIDRQTIARHLLSDQTDPFNRSPLTMDMVKPNVELQRKIQDWLSQKKLVVVNYN